MFLCELNEMYGHELSSHASDFATHCGSPAASSTAEGSEGASRPVTRETEMGVDAGAMADAAEVENTPQLQPES